MAGLRKAGVRDLLVRPVGAPKERWWLARRATEAGLFAWVRLEEPDDVLRARRHETGLHLPSRWAPSALALSGLPWTAACHDVAAQARASAATAVLVSPVFAPGSKQDDTRLPLGVKGLADRVREAVPPVLALGGIHAGRVAAVVGAGAWGVAGISGFFSVGHVRAGLASSLVTAVEEATRPGGLRRPSTPEGP